MYYILDGYNIIYKLSFVSGVAIKNDREKLIKYLYQEKRSLMRKNQITVVFDGKSDVIDWQPESPQIQGIKVLFSYQSNADDYIIELIKRQARPGEETTQLRVPDCSQVIVVTDDKELQIRARMLSASAMGVDEFFNSNKKENKESENKPSLTYKDLEEIKEELISSLPSDNNQKCS